MQPNLTWLKEGPPIAHRGLHEPGTAFPENSLPAFRRAMESGYAIEIDVQLTRDKVAVVFHDVDLKRMCNLKSKLCTLTTEQLGLVRLADSAHAIPTLQEVLSVVDGHVPLLIEVKEWVKVDRELHVIVNTLLPYLSKGLFAIQSFNPRILGWFCKYAPLITRGQLSASFSKEEMNPLIRYLLRECKLNFISKPHFIAYEADALPKKKLERMRRRGKPLLAWTITNQEECDTALKFADNIIFEGFKPV